MSAYSSAITLKTAAAFAAITAEPTEDQLLIAGKGFDAAVYPNPAVNAANLAIKGATGKIKIIVTDISGRVVWQHETSAVGQVTLPVQKFATGMYFIAIRDEKHTQMLKLLKQ
jgi:hypothetical protein